MSITNISSKTNYFIIPSTGWVQLEDTDVYYISIDTPIDVLSIGGIRYDKHLNLKTNPPIDPGTYYIDNGVLYLHVIKNSSFNIKTGDNPESLPVDIIGFNYSTSDVKAAIPQTNLLIINAISPAPADTAFYIVKDKSIISSRKACMMGKSSSIILYDISGEITIKSNGPLSYSIILDDGKGGGGSGPTVDGNYLELEESQKVLFL